MTVSCTSWAVVLQVNTPFSSTSSLVICASSRVAHSPEQLFTDLCLRGAYRRATSGLPRHRSNTQPAGYPEQAEGHCSSVAICSGVFTRAPRHILNILLGNINMSVTLTEIFVALVVHWTSGREIKVTQVPAWVTASVHILLHNLVVWCSSREREGAQSLHHISWYIAVMT